MILKEIIYPAVCCHWYFYQKVLHPWDSDLPGKGDMHFVAACSVVVLQHMSGKTEFLCWEPSCSLPLFGHQTTASVHQLKQCKDKENTGNLLLVVLQSLFSSIFSLITNSFIKLIFLLAPCVEYHCERSAQSPFWWIWYLNYLTQWFSTLSLHASLSPCRNVIRPSTILRLTA